MTCRECGKENSAAAKFCKGCAARLVSEPVLQSPSDPSPTVTMFVPVAAAVAPMALKPPAAPPPILLSPPDGPPPVLRAPSLQPPSFPPPSFPPAPSPVPIPAASHSGPEGRSLGRFAIAAILLAVLGGAAMLFVRSSGQDSNSDDPMEIETVVMAASAKADTANIVNSQARVVFTVGEPSADPWVIDPSASAAADTE